MAAEGYPHQDGGNGGAIMDFTPSGNGGPTGADNGGGEVHFATNYIQSPNCLPPAFTLTIAE
jgi:hypothetical protein